MTRNRTFGWVICTVVLLVFLLGVVIMQYNIYELTPKVCSVMLGMEVTPDNFVESQGSNTVLENRYVCAWVNKRGNLVLLLTDNQCDEWRNSDKGLQILHTILGDESTLNIKFTRPTEGMDKVLFDGAISCGLELSEDYIQIIEEPGEASIYSPWFIHMSVAMQFFEGVPSEKIKVEYVQCDENGNVLTQVVVWSQDFTNTSLP